jgi:Cytochrome P450
MGQASGLSSASYLILTHPNVRQKFMTELHTVLGQATPTYTALEKQTYLRQVVYETLRLFPPVSIFVREALVEAEVPTVVVPTTGTAEGSGAVQARMLRLCVSYGTAIFFGVRCWSQDMRRAINLPSEQ